MPSLSTMKGLHALKLSVLYNDPVLENSLKKIIFSMYFLNRIKNLSIILFYTKSVNIFEKQINEYFQH